VARIQNSVTTAQEDSPLGHFHQFRRIALGEINLLYETGMSNKVHKVKVFTARISGESSLMTVAKYEDRNEASLFVYMLLDLKFRHRGGNQTWNCILA
jgi:hypothetical protein